MADLNPLYRNYIACLNRRDWDALGVSVATDVRHNGRDVGLSGYRHMLECDVIDIPDLRFQIEQTVCEGDILVARLRFDCHPAGTFVGLPVNGRHVIFEECAIYRFRNTKIVDVRSFIDVPAIATQLQSNSGAIVRNAVRP